MSGFSESGLVESSPTGLAIPQKTKHCGQTMSPARKTAPHSRQTPFSPTSTPSVQEPHIVHGKHMSTPLASPTAKNRAGSPKKTQLGWKL